VFSCLTMSVFKSQGQCFPIWMQKVKEEVMFQPLKNEMGECGLNSFGSGY
jgi:hypothetical protein